MNLNTVVDSYPRGFIYRCVQPLSRPERMKIGTDIKFLIDPGRFCAIKAFLSSYLLRALSVRKTNLFPFHKAIPLRYPPLSFWRIPWSHFPAGLCCRH